MTKHKFNELLRDISKTKMTVGLSIIGGNDPITINCNILDVGEDYVKVERADKKHVILCLPLSKISYVRVWEEKKELLDNDDND